MTCNGRNALALAALATIVLAQGCARTGSGQAAALKTEDDKTLYAIGLSMGGNLAGLSLNEAEVKAVQAGLADAATGAQPQVDLKVYGPKIRAFADARLAKSAQGEKDRGQAFADKAAGEPGATKTASGLVLIPTQEGTGASPKAADTVRVNYRGTLADGKEFDSSYKNGQPVEISLQQVIPCWSEGLQKMKEGGKAKLICPPAIAYGDAGRPPVIPPGATLVFEVDLLAIAKP